MGVQDRIRRYRVSGAGVDLVRVEVLVPAAARAEILAHAASMREEYRDRRDALQVKVEQAIERYGVRVTDNLDLSQLGDVRERARVLARALMSRGDAKAFVLGRQLLADAS